MPPARPAPPVVTLTTDFGTADSYVAQMKGVLLAACPGVTVVDVTHAVGRHDVARGAEVLDEAAWVFPEESVHVAVVDPGVGSARAVVAVEAGRRFFVGPDNGLFSRVLARHDAEAVVRLENAAFRRPFVSGTFHGRDVMAPAAAALARRADIDLLGPRLKASDLVTLPPRRAESGNGGFVARIVHVDRFGNAVTDLDAGQLGEGTVVTAAVVEDLEGIATRLGVVGHYAEAATGAAVTLIGSGGKFEVAVREGSAAERFGLTAGDVVKFETRTN